MDLQPVSSTTVRTTSILWGVLLMLFGLAALVAPAATSLSVTIVLAWILMVVGIVRLFFAWQAPTALLISRNVAVAALYFFAGLAIQMNPLWSLTSLTLVIGAVFLAEGIIGVLANFFSRDHSTPWLISAVVTLILGAMIVTQWPNSSLWTIGTLFGINLLVTGATYAMLGARYPGALRNI